MSCLSLQGFPLPPSYNAESYARSMVMRLMAVEGSGMRLEVGVGGSLEGSSAC